MTPDEWLVRNTFHCTTLRARITPAQCEINRERDNQPGTLTRAPTGITPCNGCDWERMQEAGGQMTETREEKFNRIKAGVKKRLELIKARKDAAKQRTEVAMAKKKTEKIKQNCRECGRKMYVVARGLCGKCYYALKKTGELDEKYPAKKAGGPVKNERGDTEGHSCCVLKNGTDALNYLKRRGYSLEKSKFYKDVNKGLVKRQKNKSFLSGDLDSYARLACRNTYELDKMSGPQLRIFFGSVPGGDELHKRIQSEAERELRSPEMQVIYILSRALSWSDNE